MKVLDIFPVNIVLLLALTLFFNSCSTIKKENDWAKENLKGMVKSYTEFSVKPGNIENGYSQSKVSFQNKYNRSGNIAESIHFLNGNIHSKSIYKYDEADNKIEENHFNSIGQLNSKWTYLNDEIGNITEGKSYDSENKLISKLIYQYDEFANLIEQITFNPDGKIVEKSTYIYDKNRNVTEEIRYNSNEIIIGKSTFLYDDNRLKIEGRRSNSKGNSALKWTYEYDVKGNWTKRVSYKNETLKEVTERRYQYYK